MASGDPGTGIKEGLSSSMFLRQVP